MKTVPNAITKSRTKARSRPAAAMPIAIPKQLAQSQRRLAAAVPEFPIARMTVPEYLSLVESGFYEDRRVEMWEGWVVDRMSHGTYSAMLIMMISEWNFERRPKGTTIRTQIPVRLRESCPEPDVAVVRGTTADYGDRIPVASDILMLIEVSDSTLNEDRTTKARMYASADVEEYWIVNCIERQVEVYTEPHAKAKMPRYRKLTTYLPGQSIPVHVAGKKLGELTVNSLFTAKK